MKNLSKFKLIGVSAIAGAYMAFAGAASAGVMVYNGTGALNIDTDPETIVNLGVPAPVGLDTGIITDVNLRLILGGGPNGVSPLLWDDMFIDLRHGGTSVNVAMSLGSGNEGEFSVLFDDESPNGFLPFGGDAIGIFNPDNDLSAFDGQNAQGLWELAFFDELFPGDGDTLVGWELTITTRDNPAPQVSEPMAAATFGAMLVGLGYLRRRKASQI